MGFGNRHLAYAGHGFPGAPPDATVLRTGRTASPGDHAHLFAETPDFPAIDVPPGRHLLQLRFERPWWVHAAWLAWPGLPSSRGSPSPASRACAASSRLTAP